MVYRTHKNDDFGVGYGWLIALGCIGFTTCLLQFLLAGALALEKLVGGIDHAPKMAFLKKGNFHPNKCL